MLCRLPFVFLSCSIYLLSWSLRSLFDLCTTIALVISELERSEWVWKMFESVLVLVMFLVFETLLSRLVSWTLVSNLAGLNNSLLIDEKDRLMIGKGRFPPEKELNRLPLVLILLKVGVSYWMVSWSICFTPLPSWVSWCGGSMTSLSACVVSILYVNNFNNKLL